MADNWIRNQPKTGEIWTPDNKKVFGKETMKMNENCNGSTKTRTEAIVALPNHSTNNCEGSLNICIAPWFCAMCKACGSPEKLPALWIACQCWSALLSAYLQVPGISNDLNLRAMGSNLQINLKTPIPCWLKREFKKLSSFRHLLVRNIKAEELGNIPCSKHKLTVTFN